MEKDSLNNQIHKTASRSKFNRHFQYRLHDCLNMLHATVMLEAELLTYNLEKEGSSYVAEAEKLVAHLQGVYSTLQMLMEMTRLQDKPISDALAEYIGQFNKDINLTVVGDHFFNQVPEISESLFVIAREAIANSIRHAQAEHILVELSGSSNGFTLKVKDDGIGFTSNAPREGHGISYMNEIVESLGGELVMTSESNSGTVVTVSIPMR